MKRNTFFFLVVALFIVTTGMAVQVNAASKEVQTQNSPSVQAQANTSQPIGIALPTDATISMKTGKKREGRVVEIDEKSQKLSIQRGREKESHPLSKIEKIVFAKDAVVYRNNGGQVIRGDGTQATSIQAKWNGIPMSNFKLKDAVKGQAVVNLGPPVVNRAQLRGIVGVAKDRQFVVDEMQFDVQKKTMTIVATPY